MIVFAPAKINIGLHITAKRDDGFHNLETVFYPIPLYDVIEIMPSDHFELHEYGICSGCEMHENLCFKAWQLLNQHYDIPEISLHILKNIPVQAGLGGGSSDAAAVLKALNCLFDLKLSSDALLSYALLLGSDCPFFINAVPVFAQGKGEILQPIDLSLNGKTIFLFKPDIGISTKVAFAEVTCCSISNLKHSVKQDIQSWHNSVRNMFEPDFLKKYPHMQTIINAMYKSGAVYVSMSGSGSTFYAIFEGEANIPDRILTDMWIRKIKLP